MIALLNGMRVVGKIVKLESFSWGVSSWKDQFYVGKEPFEIRFFNFVGFFQLKTHFDLTIFLTTLSNCTRVVRTAKSKSTVQNCGLFGVRWTLMMNAHFEVNTHGTTLK